MMRSMFMDKFQIESFENLQTNRKKKNGIVEAVDNTHSQVDCFLKSWRHKANRGAKIQKNKSNLIYGYNRNLNQNTVQFHTKTTMHSQKTSLN